MKLELCNWAIWQAIWPVERKGLLNVLSDVGWEEKNVEIRGNALFIYPKYETQCVIGKGYLIEYAKSQLQMFTPQNSHKLPSITGLVDALDGMLLSIKIPNIEDKIQFFISSPEAAELWKECVDKASVTNLKNLISQQQIEHREQIKQLKEEIIECRLIKDDTLYGLSAVEQERDKLRFEKERLESESFVAKTASSAIQGMQIELANSLGERMRELKRGLELSIKDIKSKDREIRHLKNKLEESESHSQSLSDKLESANTKLNKIVMSLHDASTTPDSNAAYLALAVKKNHELELENKKLGSEVSKMASRFYDIRSTILNEFNECLESISFEEAFEMMKSWILCSELKIAYYDSLIAGTPDKSLCERLYVAQKEFAEVELRARASYVIHKSRMLNMIIEAGKDQTLLEVTNVSKKLLTRLAWLLGEDGKETEFTRKSIEPPIRIMHSAEKELNRKTLEIKKLEAENNSLRVEVRRLASLVGGQVHWENISKVNKLATAT